MSTIACPKCGSVFPLAQVAQFEHFTCGACGNMVPVPAAQPVPVMKPMAPQAPRAAQPGPHAAPPARPAAPPTRPAAQPAPAPRPASGPPPAPRQAAPASAPRPAAPAPAARPPAPAARPAASAARPAAPTPARPAPAPAAARAPSPAPVQARPAAAAPTRRAAAPPPVVEELEPLDEGDDAAPRRGRRGGRDDAAVQPKSMGLLLAGVGVVVVGIAAFFMLRSKSSTETATVVGATGGATPVATKTADPEKDPAAWKALPEADRKTRAQMKAAGVDPKQESAAKTVFDFLMARDEKDIALGIATDVAKARPDVPWPHEALGHVDLREQVDKAMKECPLSDFNSTEPMQELTRLRKQVAPKSGTWWGDADLQARIKELIARCYEDEKTLGTPFGQGVAAWVNYRKAIEVMRDLPALHGTVGPYLVFVCLPVPKEKLGSATLADVTPENLARGKEILARTLDLYGQFYEAWYERFGAAMDLPRFTQETTTQEKVLLINVFADGADYQRYVALAAGGISARAFYSTQEPRFVITYDGKKLPAKKGTEGDKKPADDAEDDPYEDAEQVQCHEGTHQLVHIYTWEATKKAIGRRPEWLQCDNRRLWFEEGFAEFCSAYVKDGDKYRFFAPLDGRLFDLWAIGEVLREKKWEDWRLKEVIDPIHSGQLSAFSGSRFRKGDPPGLVDNALGNLYYAKAWSLISFLWNAESGGKPKYRDAFLKYTKWQFSVRFKKGTDGIDHPEMSTPKDFREAFGLVDNAAFDAFEKEWKSWEANLVARSKKPEWDARRALLRKWWGLDKDAKK